MNNYQIPLHLWYDGTAKVVAFSHINKLILSINFVVEDEMIMWLMGLGKIRQWIQKQSKHVLF